MVIAASLLPLLSGLVLGGNPSRTDLLMPMVAALLQSTEPYLHRSRLHTFSCAEGFQEVTCQTDASQQLGELRKGRISLSKVSKIEQFLQHLSNKNTMQTGHGLQNKPIVLNGTVGSNSERAKQQPPILLPRCLAGASGAWQTAQSHSN